MNKQDKTLPREQVADFKGTLMRLAAYLRPHQYRLLIIFLAALASTLFSILSPKIMGKATTKLFEGLMQKFKGVPNASIDFEYILQILLILSVLYIFSALFSYMQQYLMVQVAQTAVYELRNQVAAKFSKLPLTYFDQTTTGEILSRAINDVDNISNTLQQSLGQIITSAITLTGIVIVMLTIHPLLTIIVLFTLPISLLVAGLIASRSQTYFMRQQETLGNLNGHIEEMYTGHTIIKAFGQESQSINTFNQINDKLYDAGWKAQFISGIIMPLMSFITNLAYVLISVIGGLLVTSGAIAIGDVQAFLQYTRQFSHPLTQLANIANIIQSTVVSAERIFDFLDEEEEPPDNNNLIAAPAVHGNIQFDHVRFGYKKDVPLINDMNLTVHSGETIAIVGPTGAGKTTLINLLMGFYEIDSGRIVIDGTDIRNFARTDLRSMFGLVLQETWLFNGTIRDNIAYGRANASEQEITQAAQAAYADHFIRTLPNGYDTTLNEEASNISQGQKQLLTIARAILSNPPILILDEATSSVDTRTEAHIQQAMKELIKGRTSFVIAHRLSTIRHADSILFMKNGSVIEKGSHEELLAQQGFYADLYKSQFSVSSTKSLR